jgi:hypothetical protein
VTCEVHCTSPRESDSWSNQVISVRSGFLLFPDEEEQFRVSKPFRQDCYRGFSVRAKPSRVVALALQHPIA